MTILRVGQCVRREIPLGPGDWNNLTHGKDLIAEMRSTGLRLRAKGARFGRVIPWPVLADMMALSHHSRVE